MTQQYHQFFIFERFQQHNQITMATRIYDYAVVGSGVFGLSTALYLAIQYPTVKFALIQQFKIGHGEGSSHSQIRIIRSTYPKAFYRDLCVQGINKNWPQVQQLLKDKFIAPNSCLFYVQDEDYYHKFQQVAKTSNGQIQILTLDRVKELFPSAPSIQTKFPVFHDNKAGVVYAQRYIQSMTKFLKTYKNVTIYEETSVESIKNDQTGIKIVCKNKNETFQVRTKKASLSCGRWIGKLIPQMNKIVKQARQTVSFWQMKSPQNYTIGKFPCWIHKKNGIQYYGLPDYEKIGIKYGLHSQDSTLFNKFPSEAQYQKFMIKDYQRTSDIYFKNRYKKMNKIEKCYYTVTKTQDFLIDWSDQHENILIVSPCSGHGFKFGPIIGRIVSDLLIKDESVPVFQENRYMCRLFYHLGIDLTQ